MEHAGNHGYGVYGTGKIFHNGHDKMSVWNRGHGHFVDWGSWAWDGLKPGSDWGAPPMAVTAIGCNGPCSAAEPGKVEDQHVSIRSRTHRYPRYASGEVVDMKKLWKRLG